MIAMGLFSKTLRFVVSVVCAGLIVGASVAAADVAALIDQAFSKTSTASTIDDYNAVLDLCDQAISAGVTAEQDAYLARLRSWAFNRRGEAYTEQASVAQTNRQLQQVAELDAKALADFEMSIKLDAAKWKPYHNRGVSRAVTGNYEAAIADFTKVIELQPTYANAWFNRGELRVDLSDLNGALTDFTEAIRLNPQDYGAFASRALTYVRMGKVETGLADFDQVIKLRPQHADAYVDRGDARQSLGQWREAADDYRKAIELDKQSARAYQSTAWLAATCPDPALRNEQLAIDAAQQAVKLLARDDSRYLDTLATALASAGKFEEAITTLNEAIKLTTREELRPLQDRLALFQSHKPYRQPTAVAR